ncbi:MAG: glycosyltransferase family 1 protein [Acidobacteriota bacterium]
MPTILLNALASTAGGGITYLRNVLPRLATLQSHLRFLALVPRESITGYRSLVGDRIEMQTAPAGATLGRLWWEQTGLRTLIRNQRVDIMIALGNFALFGAPVPQILFNRNDLYFSREFERDLLSRGLLGELLGNRFKRWLSLRSIRAADINVTPTRAFAERLAKFNGGDADIFKVIPFGFDSVAFSGEKAPLDPVQLEKLKLGEPNRRLLFVSHYNYFRNFETLIRALPHMPANVQLVLTTDIRPGAVYGGYDATVAAKLIDNLGVRERIAMLGPVAYDRLHHLYRLCDMFVCPSYSESFGHPLLEAMASGLPVAAANLPVHREICGEAGVYFDTFGERALAAACSQVLNDTELAASMKAEGLERSAAFSWDRHVKSLTGLIEQSLGSPLNRT